MPITTRLVRPEDRPAWAPLWQGYLDFYRTALPPETTDLTWARLNDPAEPMFGLVAEDDGRMIGIVVAVLHRSSWLAGYDCYLEDLFVTAEARGLGAGRALIEAVAAEGKARGANRLYWRTHAANTSARALYDQVATDGGFVVYTRPLD